MEKDYKDTLNLPETAFPMKANLSQREPEMLAFWLKGRIAEKLVESNKGKPSYILHDGPPYANGHIHIGHALNKILKDIIVKYNSMRGLYAPYVPGWDCHGLPIELEVDKQLGKKKSEIGVLERRKMCREYAAKFVDIQREEFKRLGGFGFWEAPYLTMDFKYEGRIAGELMEFVKRGYVYKGKKPVHWCASCVTALAEAEVEYADKESPSIFVRFRIEDADLAKLGLAGKEAYIVIWTTTPWTIPANLALAVNPDIEYSALDAGGPHYIVASALADSFCAKTAITKKVALTLRGDTLIGVRARHPFLDRISTVTHGDFVSTEDGTGIVHIAPGHGEDDYKVGVREGLDILAPVDQYGKFRGSGVEALEGRPVFEANKLVLEILTERGALLNSDKIQHSYPHCWRCKKPVIFRATEQWFISMEHEGLREKALAEIDRVQWVPTWGRERIHNMVKARPDWCISRQRTWGVPIALFHCKGCGRLASDAEVLDRTVAMITEHGADVWFERESAEILPPGWKCPKCGGAEFEKEKDILDVWFDSGVSHACVLNERYGLTWPADLYLEGSDQHRGWFQSSLLASIGTRGSAPYRTVLTHGFTVDGKGKKMSKSLGNVVAPQDIIKNSGAEILRLWVAAEDYCGDIRISKEILDRLVEAYRKIRNTEKYLLGNLNDFDGADYSGSLLEIDRWAMSRLEGLTKKVTESYEAFNFHEVYQSLYRFCIVDMSSFYLDILKDRLYTFRKDSAGRRAAQWVLNEILMTMTRLMAPVLSFTAEEVWQHTKNKPAESVFLAGFPVARDAFIDLELEGKWARLIAIRDEVNKALELRRAERFIGNALEASVAVWPKDEADRELLRAQAAFLPSLFIVSEAIVAEPADGAYESPTIEGLKIGIKRAAGAKCQRCWNWTSEVGSIEGHPEICVRCHNAIS